MKCSNRVSERGVGRKKAKVLLRSAGFHHSWGYWIWNYTYDSRRKPSKAIRICLKYNRNAVRAKLYIWNTTYTDSFLIENDWAAEDFVNKVNEVLRKSHMIHNCFGWGPDKDAFCEMVPIKIHVQDQTQ